MVHEVAIGSLLAMMATLAQVDDAIKKETARFQGEWKLESLVINGETVTDDVLRTGKLVVKDDVGTVEVGDGKLKWRFRIDPLVSPKTIDLTSLVGDDKDVVYPGIYTLEGDRFTMCRPFNKDGKRPGDFSAAADSLRVLVVWKRVKK